MSQQYDNTNRGVLFENDRKEADTHPDMKGSININGVDHWFSGWWKQGGKGQFLSLSIGKPKDVQPQQAQQPPQRERQQAAPPQRTAPPQRPGQRPAPTPQGNGYANRDDGDPFYR